MRLPTHILVQLSWSEKEQEESLFFPQLIRHLLQWDAREIAVSVLLRFLRKNPQTKWAWEALGDAFFDWEPICCEAAYAMAFLDDNEKNDYLPIISELLQSSWTEIPLLEIFQDHCFDGGEELSSFPPPLQVIHLN